jgi:hypothetical protein
MRVLPALLLAALFSVAPALADSPTVGVSLNLTSGRQQQSSSNSTALPAVPVPMFTANIPIKRFSIFAEGVPPIGPVSYGDGRGSTQATKLSYMAMEGRWQVPDDRLTLGLGTALVNQATYYSRFTPISEQSSRVAGFRFSAQAQLEHTVKAQTRLTAAFSPSMHGIQHSYLRYPAIICSPRMGYCRIVKDHDDAELASLVDLQASRVQRFGRYGLRYGLRYINYSAKYPSGLAADRERLLMPFVGLEFSFH